MPKKGKDTGSNRIDIRSMRFEQAFSIAQPGRGTCVDILIGVACEKKTIYFLAPAKSKWKVVNLIEKPKSK